MPVKLWTGLPGAGKTAQMIAKILEFKKAHPERPVFVVEDPDPSKRCNINGLDPSVADVITLDQLRRWWELPPGALICIDEAQEDQFFPLDRGQPAEWVKRLSKVRHEGMDFWLTTQHPNLISSYVRRLVDQHVHCVRKFNSTVVRRYTWGRCIENCEKASSQKGAVAEWGNLPSEVFHLYKSSNAHTMKTRIPAKAYFLVACVVVALGCLVGLPIAWHHLKDTTKGGVKGAVPVAQSAAKPLETVDPEKQAASLRQTDYAKWTRPRVDGIPWSAPMFDGLTVQAQPRVFCVAVDDGRCSCVTEQGTRYQVKPEMCRSIARDGLYNPFQGQSDSTAHTEAHQPSPTPGKPQARPEGAAGDSGESASAGWPGGVGSQSYVPPAFPGSWNADAFGAAK